MENMVVRTPTITAMLGLKGARFGFGGGEVDMEEFDGFLMGSSAIAMKEREKESIKDDERRRREEVWKNPMFGVWVLGIVKGNGEI